MSWLTLYLEPNPQNPMKAHQLCIHCANEVTGPLSLLKKTGVTLCSSCYNTYCPQLRKSEPLVNKLFFTLKARNIDAMLAYFDGKKTVDICIPESKLFIEVDGHQHNTNASQAMSDLMRTYYALKDDYFTLRIPNSLVRQELKQTIKFIVFICDLRKDKIQRINERRA